MKFFERCFLISSIVLLWWRAVEANPDAKRLYDDLLSNYNRLIRPVANNTDTVLVKLGLRLSQLIDLVSNSYLRSFCSYLLLLEVLSLCEYYCLFGWMNIIVKCSSLVCPWKCYTLGGVFSWGCFHNLYGVFILAHVGGRVYNVCLKSSFSEIVLRSFFGFGTPRKLFL